MKGKRAALSVALLLFAQSARAADAAPAELAYERALRLYGAGDASGALSSMRESHRLSGSPELLYNIARLEDETGDCPAALADYQHYLERVPQGQYRAEAEQATARLGARCPAADTAELAPAISSSAAQGEQAAPGAHAAAAGAPAVAVAPPAPRAEKSTVLRERSVDHSRRILGWSAIAAGGLAGASAVYFIASASDARSRFRSSLEGEVAGGPFADFSLLDAQHRDERWSQVLAVTSGALVGTGILLLTLGESSSASAEMTAGVSLSPGRVSAQLSSRF